VRAPIGTSLMQVASRYGLVWGVVYLNPSVAQKSVGYTTMLLAWSITEVIRYSYFALTLSGSKPGPLTWLRYNTFFVLYPMGISSEAWLIFLAMMGPGRRYGYWYEAACAVTLLIYIPGKH
jgi:very-long-chain (3R)-3-hydroxyacyl-CoA dehydratase